MWNWPRLGCRMVSASKQQLEGKQDTTVPEQDCRMHPGLHSFWLLADNKEVQIACAGT